MWNFNIINNNKNNNKLTLSIHKKTYYFALKAFYLLFYRLQTTSKCEKINCFK